MKMRQTREEILQLRHLGRVWIDIEEKQASPGCAQKVNEPLSSFQWLCYVEILVTCLQSGAVIGDGRMRQK